MELRPYQEEAIAAIRREFASGQKKVLLSLATGAGKCHGRGTKILLHDGSIKNVEDVQAGDRLMGPDSSPRLVRSLARGREELFRVIPVKGDPWTANRSHILSLVNSSTSEKCNISIHDYLSSGKNFKYLHKLWRTGVSFQESSTPFDPYMVGIYIAEGSKHFTQITNPDEDHFRSKQQGWHKNHCDLLRRHVSSLESRWIPRDYLINSDTVRLTVLAGLLDGDGYHDGRGGYQFSTQHDHLKNDFLFLARSLGFAAYAADKIVGGKIYYIINVSGDTSRIPCLIKRKQAPSRRQIKSVLRTGFSLESIGDEDFFGFDIDGDHLYILGDFTVTHNTLIFCRLKKAVAEKGNKAILVVRGRDLVAQASARLEREKVPHGVMMSGHWNWNPRAPIQVCSVDTLRSRGLRPDADLVVIDEVHQATSASYKALADLYPNAYFLGVTATPFVDKSLRHVADTVIAPITMSDLIAQGYLVAPRYFAPSETDLTGVRVSQHSGDYVQDELADRVMGNSNLTGDIIQHWRRHADGRPSILFAVSIKHSLSITAELNAAGITAEHIEAGTSDEERKAVTERLAKGETKIVSNVGILCTGVDIPPVSCLIMARPTKSLNLFIQQAGRGTRNSPGKTDFIIMDHAGNVLRHGLITDEREANLDGKSKGSSTSAGVTPIARCPACLAVFAASITVCPSCGAQRTTVSRDVKTVDGELIELQVGGEFDIMRRIERIKEIRKYRGYKNQWVWHRVIKEFDEPTAIKYVNGYRPRIDGRTPGLGS